MMTPITTHPVEENPEVLIEEISRLVFGSALMEYLVDKSEAEIDAFETFMQTHSEDDYLVEELCKLHPDFDLVLKNEIKNFMIKTEAAPV